MTDAETAGTASQGAAQAGAQDQREAERMAFVEAAGWSGAALRPLAGDASRRRYFRLTRSEGSAILMDAPPAQGEDVRPFAALAGHLRGLGFSAPDLIEGNYDHGFLLLEDLGDDLFARRIASAPASEAQLFQNGVDLLLSLHREKAPETAVGFGARHVIAPYEWVALRQEARLFVEWYLPAATGRAVGDGVLAGFDGALKAICNETGADRFRDEDARLTLRDYHTENLLWLPDRPGHRRVGLLDFQDALAGHAAYDLVSLLEDARYDVSPALASAMLSRYAAGVGLDGPGRARFEARYAALGAQRNLKILGIFARLWRRDGKPRYLGLLPRVWSYLERDLGHPALEPMRLWVEQNAPRPDPAILAEIRKPPADPNSDSQGGARAPKLAVDTAMVLAAGLGTRMRPLTQTKPKPLIEVAGRPLLEHALRMAAEAGADRAIVNAHYLADQVHAFAGGWNYKGETPHVEVSDERSQLMETGGGVAKALPLLDRSAFLVVNSDNLFTGAAPLAALTAAWEPKRMDALLLLVPLHRARGYTRQGDFSLDPEGRLVRRGERPQAPLVFTGAQIIKASAFDLAPEGPFSLNVIWDALIGVGRAYGTHHLGHWCDVGTLTGLEKAEAMLAEFAPEAAPEAEPETAG